MRKKALGADHPDTATSLNNVAAIWEAKVGFVTRDTAIGDVLSKGRSLV